jgi:hypothetical protein
VPTINLTEAEALSLIGLAANIKAHGQASAIRGCNHGDLILSLAHRLPQPIVVGTKVKDPDGDVGEVIAIHGTYAVLGYPLAYTSLPYIWLLAELEVVA